MSIKTGLETRPRLNYKELQKKKEKMEPSDYVDYVYSEVLMNELLPFASGYFKSLIVSKGYTASYAGYALGLSSNPLTNSSLTRMLSGAYAFSIPAVKMQRAKQIFFQEESIDEFMYGEKIPMEAFPIDLMLINTIRRLPADKLATVKKFCKEREQLEPDPHLRFLEYKAQNNSANVILDYTRTPKLLWLYNEERFKKASKTKQWACLSIVAGISLDYLLSTDYSDVDFFYRNKRNAKVPVSKEYLKLISPLTLADKVTLAKMLYENIETKQE